MFSVVALFTVFIGLVLLLALYDRWQQRRRVREGHTLENNLAQLTAWLENRGHAFPSVAMVTGLLNRVARREIESEDWVELQVTGLLPGTQLPQFSVLHIREQTTQHIELQLSMEWPMCLPGMGVCLVRRRGEGEEEVTCELQVDWMYVEATVRLTDSGSGLLMGYKHSITPQMALSCLVTTEGVEHSEEVASSVAHALQLMFYQLELTDELTNELMKMEKKTSSEPHTTLPENHISAETFTSSANHNHTSNHTPSILISHHDSKQSHSSQSSSPDSDISPPSTAHSSVSQLGEKGDGGECEKEGIGEEEEGRGEEERGGEGTTAELPVVNGVSEEVPVSQKLWTREVILGGKLENGEGGEVGDKVRNGEDSTVGEVKKELIHEEEVFPPTDDPPPSPPVFIITDSTETPPTSSTLKHIKAPSPLTIHKHTSSPSLPSQRSKSLSSWRRSPSYEKLQEFTLPSVKEGRDTTVVGAEEDGMSPAGQESPSWRTRSVVEMRRVRESEGGGEEGADGSQLALSLDRRKRQSLSISGSAYSVETSDGEVYPSLLVFEISDPRRTRHIVALSQAHASKLRKRVTHSRKLHIYNDHIFVATHLKQRFYCHVCKKKILGFMGKQGYMCRDCNMVVHKHCHCKTEGLCTSSKLSTMNLIYPDSVSTISGL